MKLEIGGSPRRVYGQLRLAVGGLFLFQDVHLVPGPKISPMLHLAFCHLETIGMVILKLIALIKTFLV